MDIFLANRGENAKDEINVKATGVRPTQLTDSGHLRFQPVNCVGLISMPFHFFSVFDF